MTLPSGPNTGVKYTLTGPDGTTATFNDSTDPNYVGAISEITGLDSPEVRQNAESRSGLDGGIHGSFLYGRRPITITGQIANITSGTDRNTKQTRLLQASNAMRQDAVLSWTPEGGEEQFVNVRRAQPPRITGGWVKDFQLALIGEKAAILSTAVFSKELSIGLPAPGPTILAEAGPSAMSPDNKSVYIVSLAAATAKMWVMDRNLTTGVLTKKEEISIENSSKAICISPGGKEVYVVGNSKVSWWKRSESGVLTGKETIAAGTGAATISMLNNGTYAVVANKEANSVSIYSRNLSTGVLTLASTLTTSVPVEPSGAVIALIPTIGSAYMLVCGEKGTYAFYIVSATTGVATVQETGSAGGGGGITSYKSMVGESTSSTRITFGLYSTNHVEVLVAEYKKGSAKLYVFGNEAFPEGTKLSVYPSTYDTSSGSNQVVVLDESNALGFASSSSSLIGYEKFNTEAGPISACGNPVERGPSPDIRSMYVVSATAKTINQYEVTTAWAAPAPFGSAIECANEGSMETFPIMTFNFPAGAQMLNPIIIGPVGESIYLEGTFIEGAKVVIDFQARTIVLNETTSIYSALNFYTSEWFALAPGVTKIRASATTIKGAPTLKIEWRNAWV